MVNTKWITILYGMRKKRMLHKYIMQRLVRFATNNKYQGVPTTGTNSISYSYSFNMPFANAYFFGLIYLQSQYIERFRSLSAISKSLWLTTYLTKYLHVSSIHYSIFYNMYIFIFICYGPGSCANDYKVNWKLM